MAAARAVIILALLLAWAVVSVPLHWLCGRLGRPADVAAQRWFCRSLLQAMGVRIAIEGRGSATARLLVANHISWIDVLVLGAVEPLCFLAKHEVGTWPLIGGLARQQGTVFVDRRRRRGIPVVNRAMAERLGQGRSVLLFPEGTTHDGTRLGRFHTAHLGCLRDTLAADPGQATVTVQSVTLGYSDPAAAWIGDATLIPHLWTVLRRPAITCHLCFGDPIAVEVGHDRKALGRRLAADMTAAMERAAVPSSVTQPAPPRETSVPGGVAVQGRLA